MEPESTATSQPSRPRWGEWVCLGIVLAIHGLYLSRIWGLTVDDAMITLRQARNLVEGHGFVYNPGGPRVESYTNHLLFLWQALVLALGADGLLWTKMVGALGSMAAVAGAWAIARDLVRWSGTSLSDVPAPVLFFGAAMAAISPLLTFGAAAGLETMLFGGLVTVAVWQILRVAAGESRPWGAGVLFGLAVWTRPEGLVWLAGYALALAAEARWRRRPARALLLALGIGLAFQAALMIFRLAVFGRLHPNTYYIKMAGEPLGRFFSGLHYVRDWAVWNLGYLWIGLGIAGVFLQRPERRGPATVVLLGLVGHVALVAIEGGDWMPHLRLIAPAMGIAMALATVGVVLGLMRLRPWLGRGFPVLAVTFVVVAGLAAERFLRREEGRAFGEAQTRIFGWNDAHVPLGKWLGEWQLRRRANGLPPLTVAIEDVGFVGWYSEARIVDLAGLADPDWALEVYRSRQQTPYPAGPLIHEVRPEVVVLVSLTGHREHPLRILWPSNRAIYVHPDFLANYRERVMFVHKDFPGDGYFLHVFLREDVFGEAPVIYPPKARASGS